MKRIILNILIFLAGVGLYSQDYEIAWQKDMPQMSYAQFSKDGQFIYCAVITSVGSTVGNEIWKFRSDNGEFVSKFDNTGVPYIYSMNISSSGNFIATRDGGGGSNIWDVKAEKAIRQFTDMIYTDILNDSICITIKDLGGDTRKISLNNIFSGKEVKSVNSSYWHGKIKLSHNGKMFATASEITDSQKKKKFYLTLWDTETLTEIKRFQLEDQLGDTEFKDIKFSWDDMFIGVRTYDPYNVNIYNTTKLELVLNSYTIKQIDNYGFDFLYTNDVCLYYLGSQFYIIRNDYKTILQYENIKASPLITSSNNLIFTGKALLKPKTVGVNEPKLPNSELSISPNPANDYIFVSLDSPSIKRGLRGVSSSVIPAHAGISIEIFNVFGMKITTPSNLSGLTPLLAKEGIIQIDVSNLPTGVYFIRIGDKLEKFIKW
jgi:WD40 repeat protein